VPAGARCRSPPRRCPPWGMENDDANTTLPTKKIDSVRTERVRLLNPPQGQREAWHE